MTAETLSSNFYFPASRINFVSKLQVFLQQQKLVVIEGPTGVGKTVILEELLTTALPDANKCYITASRSINDVQVRSRIIEQLFGNVLFDPEKPLVSSFLEFNQQTQLMLAIDNAHFLSGQIIGELLQVFSELNKAGIQLAIILSFDKTVSTTLLNINSSILSIHTIPLLSKHESYLLLSEYVEDLPAQTNARVKRWIENSAGIPIQLLAYDQDSNLAISDVSALNVKFWAGVVVAASLLLSVGSYWYRLEINKSENIIEDVAMADTKNAEEQLVANWQAAKPERTFNDVDTPASTVTAMPTASPEDVLNSLLVAGEPNVEKPSTELTSDKEVHSVDVDNIENSMTEKQSSEVSDTIEASAEVELIDLVQQQTVPALVVEENSKNEVENVEELTLETAPAVKEPSPSIITLIPDDRVVTTETEQYPNIQEESFYKIDNQAFLSLPADHYVLQLTAVSSEATLAQYLLSAPVNLDLIRIYKIKRNQADWIVVTYGLFNTIEQARNEAQRVEPNAWAKSVAVIQQQVNLFNQSQSR